MINTVLGGRYEILEEIGKGGMAYVYKARCVLLNRIVAIKVLRDDLEGDDEFLYRFNAEAQAAGSLDHPNIVSIFDVGQDQGKHYIVMECVDGITLKEYILQKGKLDCSEALDIAYQIADALHAAHEKGIVHRDIKPHNILVTPERNIKVADFGIARSSSGNTLSADDDIIGSVHYISPEQAKGQRVDKRSDIYSLGITLYEMITGNVPFDADSPVAVAMKQIKEIAKPINEDDDAIPDGVQYIISKAMRKNADNRYQTASDIKGDILAVIENPEIVFEDDATDNDNLDIDENEKSNLTKTVSKKLRNLMVIFGALTALVCVTLGLFVSSGNLAFNIKEIFSVNTVKVPSLVGMSLEEVTKICNDSGFELEIEETYDSNYKPDVIVSQIPFENEKVEKGSKIKITVNKEYMTLPDYTGKSYKVAQSELIRSGYKVDISYEESKKSEDVVLRQSPPANSKPKKGSTITLYVSAGISVGENYVTVPTVVNTPFSECKRILKENDLVIGEIDFPIEPHDDDKVLTQAIPQGSLVKKGTPVGLTLSCDHQDETDNDNELNSGDENNGN